MEVAGITSFLKVETYFRHLNAIEGILFLQTRFFLNNLLSMRSSTATFPFLSTQNSNVIFTGLSCEVKYMSKPSKCNLPLLPFSINTMKSHIVIKLLVFFITSVLLLTAITSDMKLVNRSVCPCHILVVSPT